MTLKEYQRSTGISFSEIARKCRVTPALISLAANGHRPKFELVLRIEKETDGMVGRDNWYPARPAGASITLGGEPDGD